jgi:hypothetical protein
LDFALPNGSKVLFAAIATDPLRGAPPPPGIKGPCAPGGTNVPQEPNHDRADCAITGISHEDGEAITDPLVTGWITQNNMETGDECELFGPFDPAKGTSPNAFLPTLGGSASAGTLYDQLINGHRYYLQSQWSNGLHNCAQRPTAGNIAPRFTVSGPHRVGTRLSFDPAASTSTHPLSSATWNFGDGSSAFHYAGATLNPVKHRYKQAGSYTVALTLVDDRGDLTTTNHMVTIK